MKVLSRSVVVKWCWLSCLLGYSSVFMALAEMPDAINVALASLVAICISHIFVRRFPNDLSQPSTKDSARLKLISVMLLTLSASSLFYFFVVRRTDQYNAAHNALLIAPFAYYAFACGKLVMRKI